jgi:hypothetical protein
VTYCYVCKGTREYIGWRGTGEARGGGPPVVEDVLMRYLSVLHDSILEVGGVFGV